MITLIHSIVFEYRLGNTGYAIVLMADVKLHHADGLYVVSHFRTEIHQPGSLLPDLKIKKIDGSWVYADTLKESYLSFTVGNAIDALDREE